jgi:hypothetical protein
MLPEIARRTRFFADPQVPASSHICLKSELPSAKLTLSVSDETTAS